MSKIPVIGLSVDSVESGGYSKFPWYALHQNYCTTITQAGGIPLIIPHEPNHVERYIDLIDGLVVTGGDFDVDPALYGDSEQHDKVTVNNTRTYFEVSLLKKALEAEDMPILGICGGMQLLNVILGGTLIQHIPDTIQNALAHEQPNPRDESGHSVIATGGSLLHKLIRVQEFDVNSAHHQAVQEVAPEMVVSGRAPDNVIECIEHKEHPFCLGVQWHPEYHISPADQSILAGLIKAANR